MPTPGAFAVNGFAVNGFAVNGLAVKGLAVNGIQPVAVRRDHVVQADAVGRAVVVGAGLTEDLPRIRRRGRDASSAAVASVAPVVRVVPDARVARDVSPHTQSRAYGDIVVRRAVVFEVRGSMRHPARLAMSVSRRSCDRRMSSRFAPADDQFVRDVDGRIDLDAPAPRQSRRLLAPGLSGGVEDLPPEVSTSAPLFGVLSRACVRIHDLSSSRTARQTSVSARR